MAEQWPHLSTHAHPPGPGLAEWSAWDLVSRCGSSGLAASGLSPCGGGGVGLWV